MVTLTVATKSASCAVEGVGVCATAGCTVSAKHGLRTSRFAPAAPNLQQTLQQHGMYRYIKHLPLLFIDHRIDAGAMPSDVTFEPVWVLMLHTLLRDEAPPTTPEEQVLIDGFMSRLKAGASSAYHSMEERWDPGVDFGRRMGSKHSQYLYEKNKRIIRCIENYIKYVGHDKKHYKKRLKDLKFKLSFLKPGDDDW